MPYRNIKLILAYDGTNYYGWQKQKDKLTIQGKLEEVLSKILNSNLKVISASRTDRGVHAYGQVVNFFINSNISLDALKNALCALLPKDIYPLCIEEVDNKFHARFWAKARRYRYIILNNNKPDIFRRNYLYFFKEKIDLLRLQELIPLFIGYHNFLAFTTNTSQIKNPYREIYNLQIIKNNDNLINIDITGHSFLPHMVLSIVGSLLRYATCNNHEEEIILREKIKQNLSWPEKPGLFVKFSLPPCGLYLAEVYY